jgi:dipeptidyl aminopeptidase/acylaminoacyl peptidase
VSQIIGDPVAFASINAGGALRYHNDTDGKFYQVLPDGSVKLMVDQVFYDVQKVTWAKAQDKAVLEYPDGSKIVYNFETKKQTTLPKHWEDFSFSPDGNELAAKSMTLAPENRWLITTKEDGTETKLIEPMGDYADRVSVNWSPSRQTVAFSQTGEPIGYDRRDILMVGINGENFKPMTVEGLDFIPQWSPTGQKLLYSVDSARSNFKPELWVASAYGDQIGANRRSIKVNTWANKCTFADDNTLFCAVPRDLPDGAGISPEVASGSYDDFYKIDLITGTKTPIPVNQDHRVDSISYNKQKNKIFFTDSSVRGIFEVPL